jgi:hypothetical protein
MLYLLGGVARSGKTRIARQFLARTGIPYFSLDYLMMGFANGLPELSVDPEADELLVAQQLWPVIRSMATAMVEDEVVFLLEGVQLHPNHVSGFCMSFPGAVRACFVGLADMDTAAKFQEIRHFGGGADDWLRHYSDEWVRQEIERIKAQSAYIRDTCQEVGLTYIEASRGLAITAAQVIQHFVGVQAP